MKLSIWQQFSSNNSSDFTIIGVFDSPEQAKQAAEEVQRILNRIRDWHTANQESAQELYDLWASGEYPSPMSAVEKELAQEYNVHWIGAIDWFDRVEVHTLMDRLVVVQPDFHVDYGPSPFDQIMNRLGGYGFVAGTDAEGAPYGTVYLRLVCDAPDDTAVATILEEMSPHDDPDPFEPESNSLNAYGLTIVFRWDYYQSEWKLETLVGYLRAKGCKNLNYDIEGVRYLRTDSFSLDGDQ